MNVEGICGEQSILQTFISFLALKHYTRHLALQGLVALSESRR